jgi:hypothetical protein
MAASELGAGRRARWHWAGSTGMRSRPQRKDSCRYGHQTGTQDLDHSASMTKSTRGQCLVRGRKPR